MGRTAFGVRSVNLSTGDEVVDVQRVDKRYVLTISEKGYGKLTDQSEYTCQTRGGKGVKTLQVTEKTGLVAGLKMVDGDEDVVLMDQEGTIIRFSCKQVSIIGRLTQGVMLMRLSEGNHVAAVEIVAPNEAHEEAETDAVTQPQMQPDEPEA